VSLGDLPDNNKLTVWIHKSKFMVKAFGTGYFVAEIGEQLAWLGAALRSSLYELGVAYCMPFPGDILIDIAPHPVSRAPSGPGILCKEWSSELLVKKDACLNKVLQVMRLGAYLEYIARHGRSAAPDGRSRLAVPPHSNCLGSGHVNLSKQRQKQSCCSRRALSSSPKIRNTMVARRR
jgi:hypothetical protein